MNKVFKKYLMLISSWCVLLSAYAQIDYSTLDYYEHEHLVFPAATGVNYYPVLGFSYHKQWAELSSSPQNLTAAVNLRLGKFDFYTPKMMLNKSRYSTKERVGMGIAFKQDGNGPLKTSNLITSYAYHMPFSWATVSLGMDLSYNEINISQDGLEPNDPNDPYLFTDSEREQYFQSSLGLQLTNEVFFASMSIRNLFANDEIAKSGFERNSPDAYFYGGYTQYVSRYVSVEPSVFMSKVNGREFAWEANLKTYIRYSNWCSIGYSSYGSVKAKMVLRAIEKIQIGYGYEHYLKTISRGVSNGHSFYIGRNFGVRNIHGIRKNVKQKFL